MSAIEIKKLDFHYDSENKNAGSEFVIHMMIDGGQIAIRFDIAATRQIRSFLDQMLADDGVDYGIVGRGTLECP